MSNTGQKFLIDSVKQNLEDIRNIIMTDATCCVLHNEEGLYYAGLETDNDGDEYMLCVITKAEQHLTQEQKALLVDVIPDNFIDEAVQD